mmetsp:Transcript_62606/g.91766  ORF Transcript_62606/g.91766 Transcript_62606/m.91766 type:complete len:248 (+) Transcript_62606:1010-1753(+)
MLQARGPRGGVIHRMLSACRSVSKRTCVAPALRQPRGSSSKTPSAVCGGVLRALQWTASHLMITTLARVPRRHATSASSPSTATSPRLSPSSLPPTAPDAHREASRRSRIGTATAAQGHIARSPAAPTRPSWMLGRISASLVWATRAVVTRTRIPSSAASRASLARRACMAPGPLRHAIRSTRPARIWASRTTCVARAKRHLTATGSSTARRAYVSPALPSTTTRLASDLCRRATSASCLAMATRAK